MDGTDGLYRSFIKARFDLVGNANSGIWDSDSHIRICAELGDWDGYAKYRERLRWQRYGNAASWDPIIETEVAF